MIKVAVIGDGGHGKVVKEIVSARTDTRLIGVLDDTFSALQYSGELYTGPADSIQELRRLIPDIVFVLAIGSNIVRKQLAERLGLEQKDFVSLIHPSAMISKSAKVGHGTVVMAGAVIQAGAIIGAHSIINTGAVVEHDNRIGDFVHLSPRVTLTGAVAVSEGAHLGAGAVVIPEMSIGRWSVVGAGAAVISPIPDQVTAVGTPARVISHIQT
ncbi:acetyltransferase [Bacillus atrophaeus]|uniref:acetyltransferase n=1 Tax=Bacillus atrophaeus TaxID=1452 RepID=UPI00227DDFC3|nr:acetyltransferase [Bacillus atrophaeus]MCY9160624.1 acetyltransferase [Bacillus atrophaeus]MCY9197634.1 acetyltransferase [Bacillus atrophaeus]